MERLHIYSGSYSDEPSYLNLLTGLPWSQLVTPPIETSRQRASRMTQARLLQEIKLCAQVARTLAVRLGEDATLLNRLRAVSFGDIPNITWTSPLAQKTGIETLSAGPELALQYKSLARTLVNLSNVAHTCQATQFGPLGYLTAPTESRIHLPSSHTTPDSLLISANALMRLGRSYWVQQIDTTTLAYTHWRMSL